MKDIIIIFLVIFLVICFIYILILNAQIISIDNQMKLKLKEKNKRPITIQFTNKKIINLAKSINKMLENEENVRSEIVKNENEFKDMIANISHDLRTPLTAIKGYQQLIDSEELSYNQREKLKIAMKHTSELGDLIEHFFEYSRLVNSEPKVEMKNINITSIITECIISVIPQFEAAKLKVKFNADNIFYAFADKEMFTRIILNLLGNCLKYSSSDVTILINKKDEYICISVINEVDNISKINEKKIFDRFYSLDPYRNNSGGLGLSIVKLLSEKMNGKAEAVFDNNLIEIKVYLMNKNSCKNIDLLNKI